MVIRRARGFLSQAPCSEVSEKPRAGAAVPHAARFLPRRARTPTEPVPRRAQRRARGRGTASAARGVRVEAPAAPRHPAPRRGDTQEGSLGTPLPSRQKATMKLPWARGNSCRTGSTDPGSTGMARTGCPRWRNGGYSLEPAGPEQKNVCQIGLTVCFSNSQDHP